MEVKPQPRGPLSTIGIHHLVRKTGKEVDFTWLTPWFNEVTKHLSQLASSFILKWASHLSWLRGRWYCIPGIRGERDCLSLYTEETPIVPRAATAEASHMHLDSLPHSKIQHGPRKGTMMPLIHVSTCTGMQISQI